MTANSGRISFSVEISIITGIKNSLDFNNVNIIIKINIVKINLT
jgi:hypothetical protein